MCQDRTLPELARELDRQQALKRDYTIPSKKRKKNQCRICRFFKDVSKSALWWQRAVFELIAKAAREHPDAQGYDLLDFIEADLALLNEILGKMEGDANGKEKSQCR